jgi:hypothetical protein
MSSLAGNQARSRQPRLGLRGLACILAGCALLASRAVWPAMSDQEARDLITAMTNNYSSYADIILTLMEDGRTLPEATEMTMLEVKQLKLRTQLARTALCLSRDVGEAEQVTNAAISAVPPGDDVVKEFVSEYVKYQRSSCLASDLIDTPPVQYATGRPEEDRRTVVPCSCQDAEVLKLLAAPRTAGRLVSDPIDVSPSR